MRNEITLTDDQIEALFDKAFSCLIGVENIEFTRDTLRNFVDGLQTFQSWTTPDHDETDGFKTLVVREIKVAKGKPKQDIRVIDFGSVRALYQSQS